MAEAPLGRHDVPTRTPRTWALIAIVAVAAMARFYALGRIPYGIWYDEAVDGLEGLQAVSGGHFPLFYPSNFGREGLFINLIGWSERSFGATPFALRLPSAITGIALVVFLYLLADSLYSRRVALFAAWFAASAFWPVAMSRIGFRAVLAPVCLTAAVYFAVEGRKRDSLAWMVAAGVACGLGFHTYPTYRVAVLLLLFVFSADIRRVADRSEAIRRWAVLVATATVVALPIFIYWALHRADFLGRSRMLVFHDDHPVLRVLYGVGVAARMFVLDSDVNWRHNLSGAPEFAWPLAIFFLAGVGSTFWHLRTRRGSWEGLPWAWLLIGLIPCFITYEVPHAMRASIAMPAALLLCALGADALMCVASSRTLLAKAMVLLAILAGANELTRYFVLYSPSVAATEAFVPRDAAIARELNAQPASARRYVIVQEDPYYRTAVLFWTYGHPAPEFIKVDDVFRGGDWSRRFPPGSIITSVWPDARAFLWLRERGVRFRVHPRGEIPIAVTE